MTTKSWMPEITYEEADNEEGQLGHLPLIHVPAEEVMPTFIMLWEARETGEYEPGSAGEEVPVVEWELRQYARMDLLKSKLTPEEYDNVRAALGLEPFRPAAKAGQAISQKVRESVAKKELAAMGKPTDV